MRQMFKLFPIILLLILITGCGGTKANLTDDPERAVEQQAVPVAEQEPKEPEIADDRDSTVSETVNVAQEDEAKADINKIEVSFDYTRMSTHASNQIAVWVEDESGQIIKTIYVSDFTAARRGYESREDALNHWALAADPATLSDDEIDAISSATPQAGNLRFVWDLTDESGDRVTDGIYFIKLEGTLYWSSNILFEGEINIPGTDAGELDIQIERSEPKNTENENMIQNVRIAAYDRD